MEQKSKTWLWVVVAAVIAAAAWLGWSYWPASAPSVSEIAGPALSADDTTTAIEAELNATDFGDLEAELQSTEADLNSL
ncbi:MAG: hypothetical protein HYY86_01005 [Candidatus Harrisonbacteria bacterium]|nr:hypothetical protein [Candidatus Harrisonbacteria bacterium]